MMCYRDRTYCQFFDTCKDGEMCARALTERVRRDAEAFNLPLCTFIAPPKDCYTPKEKLS